MQNSWIKSLFAVQGKYVYLQKKLNLKSIRLSYLSRGTNIHYTFVILSLSDLDMTLKQKEMMKKTKKIKFSGLHYLTWDIQEKKTEENMPKKCPKMSNRKGLFFNALETKTFSNILLHQRHYSHILKIKF